MTGCDVWFGEGGTDKNTGIRAEDISLGVTRMDKIRDAKMVWTCAGEG